MKSRDSEHLLYRLLKHTILLVYPDTFISAEEVLNLITNLYTDKADGSNDISPFMLKTTASSIASSLAKLFSFFLKTGVVEACKCCLYPQVRIKTVPKLQTSVTPKHCNKILEKIVYSCLWEHIVEHAPISDYQWDFQKQRSATTALLFITHEWYTFLDKKGCYLCVL